MFLASPVKRGRLFTLTAHVQVLAKNMAAKTPRNFVVRTHVIYVTKILISQV